MLDGQRGEGMADGRPAIELTGLTKRYRRGKGWFTAVNDVTLSVPPGQVIGLLGPNGAGKTTTIKMACAHRRHDPDQRVRRGAAPRRRGAADRRGAGGVPQRVLAADRVAEPDVLRAAEGAAHRRDQAPRPAAAHRPGPVGPAG